MVGLVYLGLAVNSLRAHTSPPGCFANRSSIDIVVLTPCITNGGLARFEIDYENTDGTGGCDVTVTNTAFLCPGANGLPAGPGQPIIPPNRLPTNFVFGTPLTFIAFITCKVDVATFSLPDNDVLVRGEFFGPLHANASDTANGGAFKEIPVKVFNPCIDVEQECVNPCTPIGQPIQIRGTVRNCGDEPLVNVTANNNLAGAQVLTDAGGTPLSVPVRLTPGQVAFFRGQFTPSGNLCGPFSNTTTARGEPECTGNFRTDADTDVCHVTTSPAITLTKDCRPVGAPCDPNQPRSVLPGGQYTETFVVQNTGNVTLNNVTIQDSIAGTLTCAATLAPGARCTNVITLTAPLDNCLPITDRAIATAQNACPPDATCPFPPTVQSAEATCTMNICCNPKICIVKEVACTPSTGICDGSIAYSDFARGVVGASFCYKITINNCGDQPLDTVVVRDNDLGGVLAGFPSTLAPGASATAYFKKGNWGVGTHVNTATVSGVGGSPRVTVTTNDTATVELVPISIACVVTLTSTFDMDERIDNCVTIPEAGPVHARVCITNTSPSVRVAITSVSGLPCAFTLPDVILEPGQGLCVECDFDSPCQNQNFVVTATGEARAGNGVECIYDSNGNVVRAAPTTCPACIQCVTPSECRVTGGGILYPGNVDQSCIAVNTTIFPFEVNRLTVRKITHGGQLGAPFSQMDCGAVLGNPCIRGQWSHIRHYEGKGNPRDVVDMDFHSTTPKGVYDSLFCACLGCCDPTTGAFIPAADDSGNQKFKKFVLCNPDDHKICGPMPRPAPANSIIWSGVGKITPTDDINGANGRNAEWVVFRIYIEDRSEPGGNHPGGAVEPADIYCFQAWKTGIKVSKRPDFNTIWTDFRRALGQANCDFLSGLEAGAQPIGTLPSPSVNGVTADIQDCGPMLSGNHQIHPATGATCNQ
jgi:uncharacterized repeat protein (TIGR01451 family)